MATTILIASVTALISNKIRTGEFTKSPSPPPMGTTIYTRFLHKKMPHELRLSEVSKESKTNL